MGLVGLIAKRILMPPSPTPEQVIAVGQLASRWGIGSILILFIIGGILFYFVDEEKGRQQAELLAAD
jgi:UMF1 family MFS transporter